MISSSSKPGWPLTCGVQVFGLKNLNVLPTADAGWRRAIYTAVGCIKGGVLSLFDGHSNDLCRQHLRETLRIVAACADRLIRKSVVA